ncbi:hypothetical protein [Corynebacterium variabile]|uniref:hypothetical protein n=1 Tax=Corynebacterium variabile TaxID=1727 RepID=UPI00289AB70C|nr:hypothetical protein [Corynebacterium variabile]
MSTPTPSVDALRAAVHTFRRTVNPDAVADFYDLSHRMGDAPWNVAVATADLVDASHRLTGSLDDLTGEQAARYVPAPGTDPTTDLVDALEDVLDYAHCIHEDADLDDRLEAVRILVVALTGERVQGVDGL